jgi:integrase
VQTVSLSEAREEALRLRKQLVAGKDPKVERARERHLAHMAQAKTFRVFAREFIIGLEGAHRNAKAHAQWTSSLERYAFPVIGDVPLKDIDVHMVLEVLTRDNAWQLKTETMRRVRGRIERILGAAAVLGHRAPDNPARYANFLSQILPARRVLSRVAHHPSLPYEQMPKFMRLVRLECATSYRALEFLILTATRTSEVTGALWTEIDWDLRVWSIPASRTKSGRGHRVPLSGSAFRLLHTQRQEVAGDLVFPGAKKGKPLSQMAMLQAMRGMRERKLLQVEAVPHGARASFRTWAAAATDFPRELAEAALGHALSPLEKSYQRGDQLERRRSLMEAWAQYCDGASQCVDGRPQLG